MERIVQLEAEVKKFFTGCVALSPDLPVIQLVLARKVSEGFEMDKPLSLVIRSTVPGHPARRRFRVVVKIHVSESLLLWVMRALRYGVAGDLDATSKMVIEWMASDLHFCAPIVWVEGWFSASSSAAATYGHAFDGCLPCVYRPSCCSSSDTRVLFDDHREKAEIVVSSYLVRWTGRRPDHPPGRTAQAA